MNTAIFHLSMHNAIHKHCRSEHLRHSMLSPNLTAEVSLAAAPVGRALARQHPCQQWLRIPTAAQMDMAVSGVASMRHEEAIASYWFSTN